MAISDGPFVARHGVAQLLFWSGLYYLFPALSSAVAADTGWSTEWLGYAFTAAFLVWAALSPFVGGQVDQGRGEIMMRGAGTAGAAILVLLSLTESFTVFAVGMICLGAVMAATLYDPCFALMLRRFGQGASRRVATVTLIAGMSTLLTFPLAAMLLPSLSWRGVLILFSGGLMLAVILVPRAGPAVLPRHHAVTSRNALPGAVFSIGVGFGAVMFSHAALLFTLPVALQEAHDLRISAVLLPAVLGPSQVAGRLVWSGLFRHVSVEKAARGLFLFMLVPPLLLIAGPPSAGLVLFALVLQGAGYGVHTILRPMLASQVAPSSQLGRALGHIAMIGLVMMAVAPAVAGFAWASVGLPALLWLLLLVNITGLAVIWLLCLRSERGLP